MNARIFWRGRLLAVVVATLMILMANARAQVSVDGVMTLNVATAAQAREILGRVDGSVSEKSLWECGAQMGLVKEVSHEDYAKYTATCVLEWTPEERAALNETLKELAPALKPYAKLFPKEVFIVKTDGREEYGGAYTRQNAVIIERPVRPVNGGTTGTQGRRGGRGARRGDGATSGTAARRGAGQRGNGAPGAPRFSAGLIAHELFHVLSRTSPQARNAVYTQLGFEFCGPLEWPAALERTRIANPDAPINQHWIDVTFGGAMHHALPVIYARTERYGIDVDGNLGGFMELRLLMVEKAPDGKGVVAEMKDGKPLEANAEEVQGLYEKIGRNTNYIIHPEETAADNFSYLVTGRQNLPSPEIVEKMKKVLTEANEAPASK